MIEESRRSYRCTNVSYTTRSEGMLDLLEISTAVDEAPHLLLSSCSIKLISTSPTTSGMIVRERNVESVAWFEHFDNAGAEVKDEKSATPTPGCLIKR